MTLGRGGMSASQARTGLRFAEAETEDRATRSLLRGSDSVCDGVDELAPERAERAARLVAESASERAVRSSLDSPGLSRQSWVRRYKLLLLGADATAGLLATTAAYVARSDTVHRRLRAGFLGDRVSYPELAVLSLMAWLAMLALSGAYRSKHATADDRDYRVPVLSALRLMAGVAIGSYLFHADLSRLMVGVYFATLAVSVLACRGVVNLALRFARKHGRAKSRLLLVGESRPLRDFADHLLNHSDTNCTIVGVCTTGDNSTLTVRGQSLDVVGDPDDVIRAAASAGADTVVIADPNGFSQMSLQQAAWALERTGTDLLIAPDAVAFAGPRLTVSALRGLPVMKVTHPQHESLLRSVHFAISRVVGALLLGLLSWLFLVIALAVKVSSPGQVLYRQKRIGYKGEEFELLKFRSMVDDAEERLENLLHLNEHDGALFKIRDDPRVTRVGRVIRKYHLDELPQLLNVVKGDMALVGPRPCLAREMMMFGEAEYRRFMVKPGMTGLWQVSGGPDMPWCDAVRTDLYYVDNWSITLDINILVKTLKVVIKGLGV